MSAPEIFRIALAGVAANKLRSGLTILGMTIGVAAVIILVAVGEGSKRQVQAQIDALGSNVLLVQAFGGRFGPGGASFGVPRTRACSRPRPRIAAHRWSNSPTTGMRKNTARTAISATSLMRSMTSTPPAIA